MAVTRIIYWLGNTFVICAALLGLTSFCIFFLDDYKSSFIFLIVSLVVFTIGFTLNLLTHNTSNREGNSEALLFLLLFWIIVPAVGMIPYIVLGVTDGFISAYFESVSAFTTTGTSSLITDDLSQAIILWRSILQWFGGVCAATFAVVVLAALNLFGTGIHKSLLFTLEKGQLFLRILSIGRIVGVIYILVTFLSMLLMIFSGSNMFDALCLSLSGVSTGGLMPKSEPLSNYINHVGVFILSITCLIGSMNVAVLHDCFRLKSMRGFHSLFKNIEHKVLMVFILVLFLIGLIYGSFGSFFAILIESIFFISTTGFNYAIDGLETVPPVILISLCLIGGSALSTAGGLKIIRILLLFRHLGTDMKRLSHPSRMLPVLFRGQHIPDRAFLSIWMYFFGYTLFLGISICLLGASGLMFENSVILGAASISNFGPLLQYINPESGFSIIELSDQQKIISSFFMISGRVEILAVLILFTSSFWRQ